MALQLLDTFDVAAAAIPDAADIITVTTQYDDVTYLTSVLFEDYLGNPLVIGDVPDLLNYSTRLYNAGDTISQICNGTTLHKYVARNINKIGANPRFIEDVIQVNSPTCGAPADVFIESFTVEDNSVSPVVRTQVRVYYDSGTFALKARAWIIDDNGSLTNEVIPPSTISGTTNDRTHSPGSQVWGVCDGNDLHQFNAVEDYPFAADNLIQNSPICVNNNPTCDLAIVSATPIPESAVAAGDGQIIVSATSSHQPITYRINGGAYTPDNIFRDLNAGVYVVDLLDDLGCFQSTTVTVVVQRNILAATPERELSNGNYSRWSAVFNPIAFLYQRKDYNITGITADNTQQISVTIDKELSQADRATVLLTQVYVKTDNYEFTLYPIGIQTPGGNTTVLQFKDLNLGTAGNDATGGYANLLGLKRGHRFLTEITYGFTDLQSVVARHSANKSGQARADISTYLRPLLKPVDNFLYNFINWRDENLGASYTVRYREEWDNGAGDWVYITDPFYVTYSARQIGDLYGGNMALYVPFDNGVDKALFLNDYSQPVYYLGLPFDLAFIYSESILGREIKVKEIPLNVNGVEIDASAVDTFLLNEDGSFLLNEDTTKFIIARANIVDALGLAEHLGVNRLKLTGVYPANTKFLDVYLYYIDGDDEVRITEIKRVRVEDRPACEYRLLKWIGPSGGWNYALFDFKIDPTIDISDVQVIDRFVEDYESSDANSDVIGKAAIKKEIVGKNGASADDMAAYQTLLYSPKVYMLSKENPTTWKTVIVETKGGDMLDGRYNLGDIEIVYRLPEVNTQKQ